MVLVTPHTETAAAETHLTEEKTLNENHSPPPCRDYTTYSELEGTVTNKTFERISACRLLQVSLGLR